MLLTPIPTNDPIDKLDHCWCLLISTGKLLNCRQSNLKLRTIARCLVCLTNDVSPSGYVLIWVYMRVRVYVFGCWHRN
jgi:hypothetical protein